MERLGESIHRLIEEHNDYSFSVKTYLLLADQMIQRLEYLHNKGFCHNSIKAPNFAMGRGAKASICYLIDFGRTSPPSPSSNLHERFLSEVLYIKLALPYYYYRHEVCIRNTLKLQLTSLLLLLFQSVDDVQSVFADAARDVIIGAPHGRCDYSALRKKCQQQLALRGLIDDGVFDWTSPLPSPDCTPSVSNQTVDQSSNTVHMTTVTQTETSDDCNQHHDTHATNDSDCGAEDEPCADAVDATSASVNEREDTKFEEQNAEDASVTLCEDNKTAASYCTDTSDMQVIHESDITVCLADASTKMTTEQLSTLLQSGVRCSNEERQPMLLQQ